MLSAEKKENGVWTRNRALNALFFLTVLSIPFNSVSPLIPAGELAGEALFYLGVSFILLVALRVFLNGLTIPYSALFPIKFLSPLIAVVLVSTLLNFSGIVDNYYGVRTGLNRLGTASMVFLFYLLLSISILYYAKIIGLESFLRIILLAMRVAGCVIVIVSIAEIAGWFSDAVREVVVWFRSVFSTVPMRPIFRLSGVSLEPSYYIISLMTILPWTWNFDRRGDLVSRMLPIAIVLLCLAAGSRTAFPALVLFFIAVFVFNEKYFSLTLRKQMAFLVVALIFLTGLLIPLSFAGNIGADDSVSNVTRSYLGSAAVSIGLDNYAGVGFGQVPFHITHVVDSNILLSWELQEFYLGSRYGELPPSYTWFGRTLAEVGYVGYLVILLLFGLSSSRNLKRSQLKDSTVRRLSFIGVSSIWLFLAFGLSSDSYRLTPLWFGIVALGLASERAVSGVRGKI